MININISIDVLNHDEVLKLNKGSFLGGLFGGSNIVKQKVEEEIKKEVIKQLMPALNDGLKTNKVKAKIEVN